MRRLTKHQSQCNKILRLADERLSGDRRVLIELVSLYLDSEGPEKEMFRLLLMSEFLISPKKLSLRINNPNDPITHEKIGSLERDNTQELKSVIEDILQEGKEVSSYRER